MEKLAAFLELEVRPAHHSLNLFLKLGSHLGSRDDARRR